MIEMSGNFWLEDKMIHSNLCVFIFIPALLHLLHLLSWHKSLIYLPFTYILYDECGEDMRGEYAMRNYEILEKMQD